MSYLSVQFAFFLSAAVALFHFCPLRHRALFLLLASYAFYAIWSPVATLGILAATLFTFLIGRTGASESTAGSAVGISRRMLVLAVASLVAYLAFFKMLAPIKEAFSGATSLPDGIGVYLETNNSFLPLGISYYTFRLLGYIIDVYWKKAPPERDFIAFATYVAFFPHIVAGPIQRSGDFLDQIHNLSPTPPDTIKSGLRRLLLGCFKKAVIADNLGLLINLAYSPPSEAGHPSALLAFYLFPLQLYADFSALTDIAIGASLLFGIKSPENFNLPFSASSISQFWRRWHMSLTSWLTDYVFLPLRMATRNAGNWGLAFSIMLNMLLIALWHNVSWSFVVFGFLHGVFLIVDALSARGRARVFKANPTWDRVATVSGRIVTFHLVALSMVFVRAESLVQAISVLSRLVAWPPNVSQIFQNRETMYGLAGLGLWALFELARRRGSFSLTATPVWGRWAFYYAVIAFIITFGHNAEEFIYFKF